MTLTEQLVALGITAVLYSTAVPRYQEYVADAKVAAAIIDQRNEALDEQWKTLLHGGRAGVDTIDPAP